MFVSFLDFKPAFAARTDLEQAKLLFNQKKYNRVVNLLMPRLSSLKRDDLLILAQSQSHLNNSSAAIKAYSLALATNKNDVEIKTHLANELFKTGKEKDAISSLKETLDLNPQYLPAYRKLIEIYEKRKNKYELRILYQDIIERFGEKIEFITKLCENATLSGFYDVSLKNCQRGIAIDPKVSENYVYLGLTFKDTGKNEEAEKQLKQATSLFSKSELAQVTYAQFLEEQKNYVQAYEYYSKAIQVNPNSYSGLIGVGITGVEI